MSHAAEIDSRDGGAAHANARAADELADQHLREALTAADAANGLVTHDFADACSLGLWHADPCRR